MQLRVCCLRPVSHFQVGNVSQEGKSTPAKSPLTYASAGVDISRGDRTKQRIKYLAQKTFNKQVLSEIGGFGGLFRLDAAKYSDPVLVSSADGVGTKLKVAFELGSHHTVGADLVNHCVNDIAVQGATPLFFLDYLATGQLEAEVTETVVSRHRGGLQGERLRAHRRRDGADAGLLCRRGIRSGRALSSALSTGKSWLPGARFSREMCSSAFPLPVCTPMAIRWRASSFSRLRSYAPKQYVNELKDKAGAALLKVHRSYLPVIKKLTAAEMVVGMAHITGGGITENLPRILPKTVSAVVETGSWSAAADL